MQAVFGVDYIYKYHNCLECFYQSVPNKNGLLLSPPQHLQISQCKVHLLSSRKPTKGWNFKQGFLLFFFSDWFSVAVVVVWLFS